MDALSQALDSVRTGAVAVRQLRLTGQWTLPLDSFGGIGFHVVTRGACWLTAAGLPGRRISAGAVVVFPYGDSHTLSSAPVQVAPPAHGSPDSETEIICGAYRLPRQRGRSRITGLPPVLVIAVGGDQHKKVLNTLELLRSDIDGAALGADAIRRAAIDLLLVQALRAWQEDPGSAWPEPGGDDAVVAGAMAIIDAQPHIAWTATALASRAGLSRAAFTRRFTASAGIPPMTYLTQRRMSVACGILRSSDAPLSAVAPRVGYASAYSFAAAFRREIGVPPGRFRRRLATAASISGAPHPESASTISDPLSVAETS